MPLDVIKNLSKALSTPLEVIQDLIHQVRIYGRPIPRLQKLPNHICETLSMSLDDIQDLVHAYRSYPRPYPRPQQLFKVISMPLEFIEILFSAYKSYPKFYPRFQKLSIVLSTPSIAIQGYLCLEKLSKALSMSLDVIQTFIPTFRNYQSPHPGHHQPPWPNRPQQPYEALSMPLEIIQDLMKLSKTLSTPLEIIQVIFSVNKSYQTYFPIFRSYPGPYARPQQPPKALSTSSGIFSTPLIFF